MKLYQTSSLKHRFLIAAGLTLLILHLDAGFAKSMLPNQCRRKIEMSPYAQGRDDPPFWQKHLWRNGMSTKG
jgi:hypothetical protein